MNGKWVKGRPSPDVADRLALLVSTLEEALAHVGMQAISVQEQLREVEKEIEKQVAAKEKSGG